MDKIEIIKILLDRCFNGVFKDGADMQISLGEFALEHGIHPELINIIHYEPKTEGLFCRVC